MLTSKLAAALWSLAASAWRCASRRDCKAGRYWWRANWQAPMLFKARAAWRGIWAATAALARLQIAAALPDNALPGTARRLGAEAHRKEPGATVLLRWMPGTASWHSVRILTPSRQAGILAGNKPKSWLFSISPALD